MVVSGLSGVGNGKGKGECQVADHEVALIVSGAKQALLKLGKHIIVRTGNGNVHDQILRFAVISHAKAGEPPMAVFDCKKPAALLVYFKIDGKHLIVGNTVENSLVILVRRQNSICTVDTNFSADINAILPLPQFDPPGVVPVVKIDWFTVKYHIIMGGRLVIESEITEFSLPGIDPGSKDILCGQIKKAQWFGNFIE